MFKISAQDATGEGQTSHEVLQRRPMLTVTFTECYGDRKRYQSAHRTADKNEAIERAVKKHWGSSAFFQRDNGLKPGWYGQIFRNLPNTGNGWSATSVTDRVSVDVN